MDSIIFTFRNRRGWWCNIEGAETDGPVVYRVPLDFYREHVVRLKPAEIRQHSHADYTGPCHSVNVQYRANGVATLATGAPK